MLCPVYTRVAFLFMAAAAAAAYAAGGTITYRWVDADGIHYSDQPHPGAEQITLSRAPVYSSGQDQSPPATSVRPSAAAGDAADFRYDSCTVIQPAQDQVLVNTRSVTIAVQANPPKRSSDRVVLSLDGRSIEPESNDQQEFNVAPIDRGTHTISASIRGADGTSLCQTAALSFHVRQPALGRQPVVTPH
jgi:hypothetical protein